MALKNALNEYKLNNSITLANRIVMAPLTRCFADENLVPTDDMASYYQKRADAGLIISEATIIDPLAQGYPNTPGIYSKEQIEGWKKVTSAVHENGGKIFLQLWHVGRVSHPFYLNGETPVAPSAIGLEGRIPRTDDLQYQPPRALETTEVKELVQKFKQAAINAIEAGFDGVEIHGANGYLIDQFLHQHTNRREDEYGGSLENRTRFAVEIVNAIIDAIGADRTGIRLSPGAYFNQDHVEGDEKTYQYLLEFLNSKNLAYVHTGIFDDSMIFDYLGGSATDFLRKHYQGNLIASGSYKVEDADTKIDENKFDLIAIGRPFIANPDYVQRIKENKELVEYNESMLGQLI